MSGRLLIIDDDATYIVLIKSVLASSPYLIDSSTTPQKALELITKNEYDVVLCDVIMPEMNGYELTSKIKEIKPAISVIQMTCLNNENCIKKAFKAGAIDFIQKPINSVELKMRLRNILKIKETEEYLNLALKELNSKIRILEEMVVKDSLTDLYNHKYLMDRLDTEITGAKRYGSPLTIVMLDLDNFKDVNDTYGHLVGDEVLQGISSLLKKLTRSTDIAGRYGGEEFLLILPNNDLDAGINVAEKIREEMVQIKWNHEGLVISISAGVAELNNSSGAELISQADSLLYRAKENGRNRVESTPQTKIDTSVTI